VEHGWKEGNKETQERSSQNLTSRRSSKQIENRGKMQDKPKRYKKRMSPRARQHTRTTPFKLQGQTIRTWRRTSKKNGWNSKSIEKKATKGGATNREEAGN